MASQRRPLLWGQDELDNAWFQQPRLDEAVSLMKSQEQRQRAAVAVRPGRRGTIPPARRVIDTDPELDDGWFG
jgi:hypothetical protein